MQRSLASLLFLASGIAFAVAAGSWWLKYSVFSPSETRSPSAAILSHPDIRLEINTIVKNTTAPNVGTTTDELGKFLENQVLSTRAGAEMMKRHTYEAHQLIIGERTQPVRLTGPEMVEIVRDDRAALIDPVTLPIRTITTLKVFNFIATWLWKIAAGLGLAALLAGLIARPDEGDITRGAGESLLALAVSIAVWGFLTPMYLIPSLDDQTWSHAIPRLALRYWPFVLIVVVVGAIGGFALRILADNTSRRQSSPLSTARYRGSERSWN